MVAYNDFVICMGLPHFEVTAVYREMAHGLAYRLYTLCECAGRAEDARAYNEVVTGWSGIESAAVKVPSPQQRTLFDLEGTK